LHSEVISARTRSAFDFVDITPEVEVAVKRSGIVQGFVLVRSRHTTAAIACNESDADLHQDAREILEHLLPRHRRDHHDYEGIDNDRAHRPQMVGFGRTSWAPAREGRLDLGTWQRLYLVELYEPRTRRVDCMVVGE